MLYICKCYVVLLFWHCWFEEPHVNGCGCLF